MERQTFLPESEQAVERHWRRRGQKNKAVLERYLNDASQDQAELLSVIRQWLTASEPDHGDAGWGR